VLPGLVREGRFHELKGCSASAVAVHLRARFLSALKNQEVLDCDEIEGLMSWNHNSGFNVHSGKPIDGPNGEAFERLARYMSRAPLSVERIHYHAEEQTVTVDAEKSQAGSRNWPVPEFFALLAAHIPCRYESLITYYGVYSSSHRGKCKHENHEERIEEIVVEAVSVTPGTSRHSSWAKWIRKIYETDPLTCSECGEPMRIIAFIIDPLEVAKILAHIGEQTARAPPLTLTDPVPSFCDFGATNFQYPEVPWYPDPPVFDF
jgi:hypothetical protein